MSTLLVRNAHTVVTMDDARREIPGGAVLVNGPAIEQVGSSESLPSTADEVLDLKGRYLLLPGLVNTHHHFYQVLTRAVPGAQNCELFSWLKTLYPIWSHLTANAIYTSAKMAAAELMLSGCTTSSDQLYLFPNNCSVDDEIRALNEMGLRFHASRGSMSVGESQGGLPPDCLVEDEESILKDSQRLIETYHDDARHSMLRIALAPCSPFSVSIDLMKASSTLARAYPGVRLHTHLAENLHDVQYSLERFKKTPGEYAESLGWIGPDVWHAHCVHLDDSAIHTFARTRTGIAHCPTSNMRLGSGAPPVRKMLAAGVPIGLGVDGSASNDANDLMQEARAALLLARVVEKDASAMTARTALELATRGGAEVLGRDDIGYLAPGMSADFIAVSIDSPAFAGAHCDLVAALVLCHVANVAHSFINGRPVICDGQLLRCNLPSLIEETNACARELLRSCP